MYENTIRSILLEQSQTVANERVSEFPDIESARFTLAEDDDFTFADTREGFIFTEAQAAELRGFAHQILWAFEYNKLKTQIENRLTLISMKRSYVPKVFKRYRFALISNVKSQEDKYRGEFLALLLSLDADEHYSACGTFPRTTENAFIKEMKAANTLFGRKLTLSDEYALEEIERSRYADRKFDVLGEYKLHRS